MKNSWQQLQHLIKPHLQVALVTVVNDDGTSICTTPLGTSIVLLGDKVPAGKMCLYDAYDTIIGTASTLTSISIFIPEVDYGLVVYSNDDTSDFGLVTDSVLCYQQHDFGSVANG